MTKNEAFNRIKKFHDDVQEEATRLKVFERKEGENQISISSTYSEWRGRIEELLQELKQHITCEQMILFELYNHESFYSEEPLEILDLMKEYYNEKSEEELKEIILETYQTERKEKR